MCFEVHSVLFTSDTLALIYLTIITETSYFQIKNTTELAELKASRNSSTS